MIAWVIGLIGIVVFFYGLAEFFFTKTFQTKSSNILPEDRFAYTKQSGTFNIIGGIVLLVCVVASYYGKYENLLFWVCAIYFICTVFRDKPYYDRKKEKEMKNAKL